MSRAIEAVLFDFGGVFTASPFRVFDEAGVELGARPGQIESIVFGPYHEDTDHSWHRLERGEISLETAQAEIRAAGAREGLHFDPLEIERILRAHHHSGRPEPDAVTQHGDFASGKAPHRKR